MTHGEVLRTRLAAAKAAGNEKFVRTWEDALASLPGSELDAPHIGERERQEMAEPEEAKP